jgi:predicted secreted hydrolase
VTRAGWLGLGLLLAGCLLPGPCPAAETDTTAWRHAGPGHSWQFPRDHHAHPEYRSEWWYVTGQLVSGAEGVADAPIVPTHGFQVTLFRLGIVPEMPPWDSGWTARDLVLGHAAVTDLRTGRHLFSEVLTRTGPGRGGFPAVGDSVLAWCRGPAGTEGRWSVRLHGDGFAVTAVDARQGLLLDLQLAPERPLVFQGPEGYSVKDPQAGTGSLYYSYTRLAARGRLAAGADTLSAVGRAWLDREIFTSQLAAHHRGWDWLSLQFDDGRDVMVFVLRRADNTPDLARATVVAPGGEVRWLQPQPEALQPVQHWTSPRTGARYPVAWRLQLPEAGIDLELRALAHAQENVGERSGVVYWEGAVAGPGCRGYVEMTGYLQDARPPF